MHTSRPRLRPFATILAILMLAAGAYVLVTALMPLFITIDPTNNPTVAKLKATDAEIPTEQRLYIPKIDINLPYGQGDEHVMEYGAWWRRPENGNPKDGGNFILSAHRFIMGLTPEQTLRKSPFYNIDKLALGDEITIDYQGARYVYVISKIYAVKPNAVEIENRTDESQLTLYSCTLGGAADGREVIVATPKERF